LEVGSKLLTTEFWALRLSTPWDRKNYATIVNNTHVFVERLLIDSYKNHCLVDLAASNFRRGGSDMRDALPDASYSFRNIQ
jgi:hypothetical protein